jgi:3-hydroxybutyryl-CoA dehydrogenase
VSVVVQIIKGDAMFRKINNITVIGAGTMGHQISMNAALNGFNTIVTDSFEGALEKMSGFSKDYLADRVKKGRLTQVEADATAARLRIVPDFIESMKDPDLVIEAVVEILDVKQDVFRRLDEVCPQRTILATNSSYIVSSDLAKVTKRPKKVCNMHYFSPALVMKLVEIVRGDHTSQDTVDAVCDMVKRLNKVPVVLNREIEGFIVNRLLEPYLFEAHRLADMGIASPEDIDKAAKYGLGYPIGPFELNDMAGLDLTYTIMLERYRKSGNPVDKPSILLSKHYFAGEFGVKTGKGFYEYSPDGKRIQKDLI